MQRKTVFSAKAEVRAQHSSAESERKTNTSAKVGGTKKVAPKKVGAKKVVTKKK